MAARNCSMARMITFPKIEDQRGNLTFVEGGTHIPFEIARVYYLYDVPGGASRGGHAHKELQQILIPITGSFDVLLDDGQSKDRYTMNQSHVGLLIPTMTWREIEHFTSGAVCMVLASARYNEADYYRNYKEFLDAASS